MLAWLHDEPDAEEPPALGPRDWLLAGLVAGTTLLEVALRDDMLWHPLGLVLGLVLALTMLWRRTHPLATAGVGFGGFMALDLAAALTDSAPFTLYAGASVVLLVYALFRWAPGRHSMLGAALILTEWVVAVATDGVTGTDAVGGLALLMFVAALGAAVRYQCLVRVQQLERVRSYEREVLARELHDTVAHHVTAIAVQAVQAQAGRSSPPPPVTSTALPGRSTPSRRRHRAP